MILGVDQGLLLYDLLKTKERAKLCSNWLRYSFQLDFLLAAWARHERKSDTKGCPLVLKKLNYAVRVEYVTTGEASASFSTQFLRVTDRAKFILVNSFEVADLLGTFCVQAWEALALLADTLAGMTTVKSLFTEGNCGDVDFFFGFASVDNHLDCDFLFL